jgi:hypothetical protein
MRVLTDRTALIQAVDAMDKEGGFAVALGKAALLADQKNLKTLVQAFPNYFYQHKAIRLIYERDNNLLEGQRKGGES